MEAVVALIPLFHACIECFEYFNTAHNFQTDLEILLVKFDVQKERLLIWGDLAGVFDPAEGRIQELEARSELLRRCLLSLQNLFSDASHLEKEYGVKIDVTSAASERINQLSSNRTKLFKKKYKMIKESLGEAKSNITQKIKWAICDKAKFETLVKQVRDLVDDLHNIVPPQNRTQNRNEHTLLLSDASHLDVPKLHLVKDACEGDYPNWSNAALTIIIASESSGTLDQRSIGDWIQETTQTLEDSAGTSTNSVLISKRSGQPRNLDISWSRGADIFFVFTTDCLLRETQQACSFHSMGSSTFKNKGHSFLPGSKALQNAKWSLGSRITKSMNVNFASDDVDMLRFANFELGEIQNEVMNKTLPLGVLYVFCGPCICAVRTALLVCSKEQSKTMHCWVRVDDRIDTSCCSPREQLHRLASLMDTIKVIESIPDVDESHYRTSWSQIIDREWLERRIYALEDEVLDEQPNRSKFDRGAELFAELNPQSSRQTAFVVLGEIESCQWMLHTSPFPYHPRMPRETEIYKLTKGVSTKRWDRSFLGTFTPRDYHVKLTHNHTSRKSLSSAELHTQLMQPLPTLSVNQAMGTTNEEAM